MKSPRSDQLSGAIFVVIGISRRYRALYASITG